jgi:predicted RNase H-like HicB family nuclease
MNEERIAKMSDNVVAEVTGADLAQVSVPHIRTAAAGEDEDVALANVDQAFDAILAALAVIDDNLPQIKTASVPEKAAVDAIKDLMETAIKPYTADALRAMQTFGG